MVPVSLLTQYRAVLQETQRHIATDRATADALSRKYGEINLKFGLITVKSVARSFPFPSYRCAGVF